MLIVNINWSMGSENSYNTGELGTNHLTKKQFSHE